MKLYIMTNSVEGCGIAFNIAAKNIQEAVDKNGEMIVSKVGEAWQKQAKEGFYLCDIKIRDLEVVE